MLDQGLSWWCCQAVDWACIIWKLACDGQFAPRWHLTWLEASVPHHMGLSTGPPKNIYDTTAGFPTGSYPRWKESETETQKEREENKEETTVPFRTWSWSYSPSLLLSSICENGGVNSSSQLSGGALSSASQRRSIQESGVMLSYPFTCWVNWPGAL